ncbi:MAG TPA: radical SAM protein [Candidatus Norongarragalinales archaeon]|nr:radical SAM protein [Candidatus Norongarragalinales archaeon]
MNLKFSSIIDFSETAWPGKTASVVYLAGCPLQCYWCNVPFLVTTSPDKFDSKPNSFFIEHFSKLQASTEGVVFMGGEPLMQGNAVLELSKILKHMGFAIRLETSGYYPESLRDLLPFVDYVQMDVKTPIDRDIYAKATAFRGDPEILVSKVLSSLAFLEAGKESKRVFKELRTTVVPGLNDTPEAIQSICEYCKFADLYALQQIHPGEKGGFVNEEFELPEAPSKEKMYELAYAAKKTFKEVLLRFNDGSEELV